MTVQFVGQPAVPSTVPREAPAPEAQRTPIIDSRTIRLILYLGLKGDVSLRAPEPRGGGLTVDTYA